MMLGFFSACEKDESIDTFINVRLVQLASDTNEADSTYYLNFEAFFVEDPQNLNLSLDDNRISKLSQSYDRVFYSDQLNPQSQTNFSISVEYKGYKNEALRELIPLAKTEDLIIDTSEDFLNFNWKRTDSSDKYILHIYDPFRDNNSFDLLWVLNSPEISVDKDIISFDENSDYFVIAGSVSGLNTGLNSFNIKNDMASKMIFFSGSFKRITSFENEINSQDSINYNYDAISFDKLNEVLDSF